MLPSPSAFCFSSLVAVTSLFFFAVSFSPLLFFFLSFPPCSLCFPLLFSILPVLFLSSLSPLFSSSFSGFYKPKNGLRCNVQLGNGM
jgi:hypothetical protein